MTFPRLLRRPEVEKITGLSRASIYEKMNAGDFPRPVKTGIRAVAWVESEIESWNRQRVADRDDRANLNSLSPAA